MNPIELNYMSLHVSGENSIEPEPQGKDHQQLIRYLWSNGHFNPRDENNFATQTVPWHEVAALKQDDALLRAAIHSWQSMRPKMPDHGIFDRQCQLQAIAEFGQRCGLPDVLAAPSGPARWPDECKHDLTTSHNLHTLEYTKATDRTIDDAWDEGLDLWNNAADLTLMRRPTCTGCRITAQVQPLGQYILAWSELANGDCRARLLQAYNTQISWKWHLLWTTICHEIGHAIGIGHGGSGIMQPAHDPTVHELDAWDVREIEKRYGPSQQPPPPPPPTPQPWHHATITLYDSAHNPITTYDLIPRDPNQKTVHQPQINPQHESSSKP